MKRVDVNRWHLVRFLTRLKFHRVPDLLAPIGKNTIRRSVEDPRINDNQLSRMLFEFRRVEYFDPDRPVTICLASQLALNSK